MSIETLLLLLAVVIFALLLLWGQGGKALRRRARKKWAGDNRPYRMDAVERGGNLAAASLTRHRAAEQRLEVQSPLADIEFEKCKLLGASAQQVFSVVEATLGELDAGHRVMAQISLGEVIKPRHQTADWKTGKDAFASIYSHCIDIVVLDPSGVVALAIEFQRSEQGDMLLRHQVTREVLRRAGVLMLEVDVGVSSSELRAQVMRHLAEPARVSG